MPVDFFDAHKRHWEDAERLFGGQRWPNADQLYGISAECGLKKLMMRFGMRLDADGSPGGADKVHADRIWARYESYRSGHPVGGSFALPTPNPFSDWNVSQRYAHSSDVDQTRAQSHRNAAQAVEGLVRQAQLAGLI